MDGSAKGKNRGHGGKPIKTYNDLYKLDPGESIGAGYSLGIYTRVPGGWKYTDGSGVCFVPYDEGLREVKHE